MSHTLLPVTQNDWCVLQHSQAFDREGKRRGNGRRGTAQSVTSVPYFWGTREKHTCTVQTLHIRFLPKTVVWRVACVKNVAWQHLHRYIHILLAKLHPQSTLLWKGKNYFFQPFSQKNICSHSHTHLNPQLRGSSAPFTYTLCHLDTLYCTH